ncbi:hypothetical protein BJ912DRAFT_1006905, partial [Pholiota molesta]
MSSAPCAGKRVAAVLVAVSDLVHAQLARHSWAAPSRIALRSVARLVGISDRRVLVRCAHHATRRSTQSISSYII